MIRIKDPCPNLIDEVQPINSLLFTNTSTRVSTISHRYDVSAVGMTIHRDYYTKTYIVNMGNSRFRININNKYSCFNTWFSMTPGDQINFINSGFPSIEERSILIDNLKRNPYDFVALTQLYRFRTFYKITKIELTNLTKGYCSWKFSTNGNRFLIPVQLEDVNPFTQLSNFIQLNCLITWGIETRQVQQIIQPYSTRAEAVWPITQIQQNLPLMGIELELDAKSNKEETALKVHELMSHHCIIKNDGSVPAGFEIVSKPAQLEEHLREYEKLFPLLKKEMVAKSNCGMHIHINRKGLSFLQLAKLGEFINLPDNLQFITTIAGRKPNSYCKNVPTHNISHIGRYLNNGTETFGERHISLNFTNRKTIEFRMFAATTDFDVFARNLQFVAALREYTSPGRTTLTPKEIIKAENFLNWVKPMKRIYPQLVQGV